MLDPAAVAVLEEVPAATCAAYKAELERVRHGCARPDDHLVVPLDLTRSESFPDRVEQRPERRDVFAGFRTCAKES